MSIFGIGTDIVSIDRIKNSLKKRKLNSSTWNTIQSLPKKLRYEMGFSLSSTKQIVNKKKEDKDKDYSIFFIYCSIIFRNTLFKR